MNHVVRSTALALALTGCVGGAAVAVAAPGVARAPREAAADVLPPVTVAHVTGHGGAARVRLEAEDAGAGSVARTMYRVDGGAWQTYRQPKTDVIFDGTKKSFARWQHLGPGSFQLQPDGTLRTKGGLGMLWYPVRDWGSAEFHLRWRSLPPPSGSGDGVSRGNSGAIIRFPNPVDMVNDPSKRQPCQMMGTGALGLTQPAWAAISCGNEIQINDRSPEDPQRTGSVYDFDFLHDPEQRPVPEGQWTDYDVKVTGGGQYTVTVIRDGHVINQWVNTPGQLSWRSGCYCGLPAEDPADPPSDLREFARGYFGLQNHSDTDVVEFGRVSVDDLSGAAGAFTVTGEGAHVVEFRSIDAAGNAEPVRTVRFTIGNGVQLASPAAATGGSGSCTAGPADVSSKPVTCHYVASGDGTYVAATTSVWSITVIHRVRGERVATLVATHPSAPSLPVSGSFHAEKGDIVEVTLGPDLNTERDSNVPLDGALGTVTAGDA